MKMKNCLFLLLLVTSLNCVSKKSELFEAFSKMKKANLVPSLNFVIDTRGTNDSGRFLVRSIRYFDTANKSFLIYPNFNEDDLSKFYQTQSYTSLDTDSIVSRLLNLQKLTNAVLISSNHKLGEFVYFNFSNEDKILVYCPDEMKIYNNYWKKYIVESSKIDNFWYVINRF